MTRRVIDIFIDPRFAPEYSQHPLVLVDVGARGGVKRNWAPAQRYLRVLGFEPDPHEYARLVESAQREGARIDYFNTALHSHPGSLSIHVARDRGLSSIFEPDRAFLDRFPEAGRFDTEGVQQVQVDTLDNQLLAHHIQDIDFIKADTQGSELFVLQGASHALSSSGIGVEVEVEFTPIYKGQPLFTDVDRFLRDLGYELFDLKPCYWKRGIGRNVGGSYGQIVWADALYLRTASAVKQALAGLPPGSRKSKVLRMISVALLYGYLDFGLEVAETMGSVLSSEEADLIKGRIREQGEHSAPSRMFPVRRRLASAFRRLWRVCRLQNEGWSVSDEALGNRD